MYGICTYMSPCIVPLTPCFCFNIYATTIRVAETSTDMNVFFDIVLLKPAFMGVIGGYPMWKRVKSSTVAIRIFCWYRQ